MEQQRNSIYKVQRIPQASIYFSSQVSGRRMCLAAHVARSDWRISCTAERVMHLPLKFLWRNQTYGTRHRRGWVLNAWLLPTVVLQTRRKVVFLVKVTYCVRIKSTGRAQLKASDQVTFLHFWIKLPESIILKWMLCCLYPPLRFRDENVCMILERKVKP